MQASPCAQDLRCVTCHTCLFNRFPNMLFSQLSFLAWSVGCPGGILLSPSLLFEQNLHRHRSGARKHFHLFHLVLVSLPYYHISAAVVLENLGNNQAIRMKGISIYE
jgi:hypothetical protein